MYLLKAIMPWFGIPLVSSG